MQAIYLMIPGQRGVLCRELNSLFFEGFAKQRVNNKRANSNYLQRLHAFNLQSPSQSQMVFIQDLFHFLQDGFLMSVTSPVAVSLTPLPQRPPPNTLLTTRTLRTRRNDNGNTPR